MNWKQKTEEELRCFETRKLSVRLLGERIGVLEALAASNGDAELNEECAALRSTLAETNMRISTVTNALSALDPRERAVIERFYLNPVPDRVDVLCEELAVEPSTVYRAKNKGLSRMALALFGVCI